MATITIDGVTHEVEPGQNLLEACLSKGLDLPYFCWHPAMGSIGACRQCAVVQYQNEEDQRGRLVMACMTPVTDGAIFSLSGDKAKTWRDFCRMRIFFHLVIESRHILVYSQSGIIFTRISNIILP